MNDGNTGYPWSQGDPLLAADLNAAIAGASSAIAAGGPFLPTAGGVMSGALSLFGNATSALHAVPLQQLNAATGGNGPFLPISGGTVSGQINGYIYDTHNQRTQALGAGGTMQTPLGIYSELSGVRTGGNPYLTCVNVLSDTADMGGAGLAGLAVIMNGGTTSGAMGGRSAIGAQINFTGAPGNKAANTGEQFLGVSSYCVASGSVGGVSGSGGPYGSLWGGLFNAQLESGATFWNQAMGCEINVGVAAGASAAYVTGAAIVLGTHNQAPQQFDQMLGFGMISRAGNVGLKNGIVFGGAGGWWPIDPSGSLMTTNVSLIAGGPAYTATYGIDLSGVTFSTAAFKSTGFAVSPSGVVTAAGGTLTGGINWGSNFAASATDLSKHISLYANSNGISVTSGSMNFVLAGGAAYHFFIGGTDTGYINPTGLNIMPIGQQTAAAGTFTALTAQWAIAWPLPSVKTGTSYACTQYDVSLILNPTGAFTITLPSVTPVGRVLLLKLVAAFAVTSASSNVVPMIGGAASNAIMPATAGKFCLLQSDGTAWQIMMAN